MERRLTMILVSLFCLVGGVMAQTQITGTVINAEDGQPVIGASVKIIGTQQGTVSDMDGKFSLTVPNANSRLEISYVGMHTKRVSASNNLKVTLEPDLANIDEVVVTALGIKRDKKSLGYAAQEIDAKDLTSIRQTNLNNALAGKIAGARFIGGSAAKFDEGGIVLRGVTTLTDLAGTNPIYVVDGVITDAASVNMDDVQSVNVLKGPAATALYGSRGGNGAVIIVTKGFAEGKEQQEINISHTLTFDKFYNHVKMQKDYGGGYLGGTADDLFTYEWQEGDPEMYKPFNGMRYYDYADDASWGPKFDPSVQYLPAVAWDPTSPYFGKTDSWANHFEPKDLFQTGTTNTTNVSFARSGKDYTTRVSFSNVNIKGITPNSDAQRRFFSVKSAFTPYKNLKVTASYNYAYKMNHNAAREDYGSTEGSAYSDFLQWGQTNVNISQYKDYKRPDGTMRTWNINDYNDFTAAFHESPFAYYNENNRKTVRNYHTISGDLEYTLPYDIKVGFKVTDDIYSYVEDEKLPDMTDQLASYYQEQLHRYDLYMQGRATWAGRLVQDRLSLNAALFLENRRYHQERTKSFTRDGLLVTNFYNVANSVGLSGGENEKREQKIQSIFGTFSAGWDDTYYAEFSLRNDWSSTLPKDHNSYLYGGGSLSAIASNWIKASWLNFWKIRMSAAQVGSTLDPYRLSEIYEFGKRYSSTPTLYKKPVLVDDAIKPTITTSYEIGTEFKLFNNRFWGDFNLYRRDSKNQIINVTSSSMSGYSSRLTNAGLIRNSGWELSLGGTPIKTKDWQWDLYFNIAHNSNKLVELTEGMNRYRLWGFSFYDYLYNYAEVGKPMGALYTSRTLARDDQGRLILKELSGANAEVYGQYIPTVDTETEKYLGNTQPKCTGGFGTSVKFKGFTLSAAFDFQTGGKVASITNMWGEGSGMFETTAGTNDKGYELRAPVSEGGGVRIDGVIPDGNGGYTPVTSYVDANYYYQSIKSSVWDEYIYDATYVKLRELSLSYEFPKSLLSKTPFKAASIAFVASNPWLIYSKVPNLDPSEISPTYGGLEQGQAASARSFGFTVNITL